MTSSSGYGEASSSSTIPPQTRNDGNADGSPNEEGGSESNPNRANDDNSRYECNICLDMAKDPVISMCGHLFCWPCLHTWLDTRPNRKLCPVCKSAISRDKVIPLYGRGCSDTTDPRDKVPPRPRGQRSEESTSAFHGFHWGGGASENVQGVQFSLGIGVFPLAFFGSILGFGNERRAANDPGGEAANANNSRQAAEEQFLSNIFMVIGVIFMIWLLIL